MKHSLVTLALTLIAAQGQAAPVEAGANLLVMAGNSGLATVSLLAAGLIALGLARHRAK